MSVLTTGLKAMDCLFLRMQRWALGGMLFVSLRLTFLQSTRLNISIPLYKENKPLCKNNELAPCSVEQSVGSSWRKLPKVPTWVQLIITFLCVQPCLVLQTLRPALF